MPCFIRNCERICQVNVKVQNDSDTRSVMYQVSLKLVKGFEVFE
jgi:hypothetical protein